MRDLNTMMTAIMCHGGQGRTVEDALISNRQHMYIFLDDKTTTHGSNKLRDRHFLEQHKVIVANGDNVLRKKLSEMVKQNNGSLTTVVHAGAHIATMATIKDGSHVGFGAHIGPEVVVGTGCIINTLASIGHGCKIGDYVNICDGAILGGDCVVGEETFIGLNATILPKTKIGCRAFIGAGAIVARPVADGERVVGSMARRVIPSMSD